MSHLANCEKEFVVYLETISSGKVALVITVRLTYMICTGQDNAAVNPITNPNLTVFPCSRYTSHLVQQGALPIAVGLSCVPVVVWGALRRKGGKSYWFLKLLLGRDTPLLLMVHWPDKSYGHPWLHGYKFQKLRMAHSSPETARSGFWC